MTQSMVEHLRAVPLLGIHAFGIASGPRLENRPPGLDSGVWAVRPHGLLRGPPGSRGFNCCR